MKRAIQWIAGVLAVLIALGFGYRYIILDFDATPCCHMQIKLGLQGLMRPSERYDKIAPKPFPNVNGRSHDSLAALCDVLSGYMVWTNDYNYVPGLREDDPPDLVLMYMNRPTRWIRHGNPPTIFSEKRWMIIPVDFGHNSDSRPHVLRGEFSEIVSSDQFSMRLRRTLDFVRTNERPNWQMVLSEHEKFLKSIEEEEEDDH